MSDATPPEVEAAARRRSEARAARDWATADTLRAEIEAAGWRVVDAGTAFRLEPASPPDVEVGGEIRYGRSDAVPSRLGDREEGLATVVLLATAEGAQTRRALDALVAGAPSGVHVVVVADGLSNAQLTSMQAASDSLELVRTSAQLGQGAALNIGLRRSRAPIVVVLDPSITAAGDIVSPLVDALADPAVAVVGPFGLVSRDLRRFEEVVAADRPVEAAAIQGYCMAFRRADAAARGPVDEAFRFYRNLDVWWSLVLRDEGEGAVPRRAVVVPGLGLQRDEPHAWAATAPAERDRLSKRNFYRVRDRFRTRMDLAVPPPA